MAALQLLEIGIGHVLILLLWAFRSFSDAQEATNDEYYDLCAPFTCGNISFTFPFWDASTLGTRALYCGLPYYGVACYQSKTPRFDLIPGSPFDVNSFYGEPRDSIITLTNNQLINDLKANSCTSLQNLTLSYDYKISRLSLPAGNSNFTFFVCPQVVVLTQKILDMVVFNKTCGDGDRRFYLWLPRNQSEAGSNNYSQINDLDKRCQVVGVPVSDAVSARPKFLNASGIGEREEVLLDLLKDGFALTWNSTALKECYACEERDGRCGFDSGQGTIYCSCRGGCGTKGKRLTRTHKIVIGIASGCMVLMVGLILVFKRRCGEKCTCLGEDHSLDEVKEAKEFIKTYQSFLVTIYSFKEVKKMTNTFKEKLGEGGFGTVYKGKLQDGRLVAVKLMHKSSQIGQDFTNEVATIGRIHHVNIIRLLGFCLEGSKQALVYEYMANGSLGDVLYRGGSDGLPFGMEKFLEIAMGVAQGIEYLHRGCDSRILHLDIKPQNVLLDHDLNPKISDFGLAKAYSRNRSFITMTGTKGTAGFIAPEIFMRNLGNPSPKSDVYSFGMLLLEMVGGRNKVEATTSTSSDAYFPGWIYEKLKTEIDEVNDCVVSNDVLVSRKMVMIGLWCIQVNPRDRPSMTRVLEMLSGDLEAIPMPPKPFFFSPPTMQSDHESISLSSSNAEIDERSLKAITM